MSDIFGNSPSTGLTDVVITDSTTNGSFTITTLNNETYNLQTPDNGDNLDVLTTDGIGNIYWAPSGGGGGTPTFQDVYNASSTPANINLLSTKPINFLGTTGQTALKILSNISGFTRVEGNAARFEFGAFNSLEPLTNENINILGESAVITDRTIFTEDQEFITKKYVDDNIPPSSNPTFQDVYNNSSPPVELTFVYGKNMKFETEDSEVILSLYANTNTDYGITAEYASLGVLNSTTSTSGSFIKNGGTSQQYLMADGSTLQYSQNSGNSNFYLYDNSNNITTPPPSNGHIGYNNSVQANATIIYISHLTSDNIDIDIFFTQISTIQEVYIQDKNSSINFIKYKITGTPTIITNSYIEIPVLYTATIPPAQPNGAGTGLTSFGNNHPLIISFFTNSIEVDERLTTLETKTQYQTASANNTTFAGTTTADTFIKTGGTNQQYLMADGSTSSKFNQNLNTTDSVSFNSVALTAAITTNTQATTKLYVDNKVGAVAITSTDNNLLGVSGVNPTFSLTPKYTYRISFGGNNNNTTSQWLLPGSVRTATISNTNVATHQALIPINSTLVWASIQRTTTTGVCSLAYSVSNGAAVPITPSLTAGQAQNPTPYPLNVNIPAGGNLAMSVLSSVLSGNTIVSLLLRSN